MHPLLKKALVRVGLPGLAVGGLVLGAGAIDPHDVHPHTPTSDPEKERQGEAVSRETVVIADNTQLPEGMTFRYEGNVMGFAEGVTNVTVERDGPVVRGVYDFQGETVYFETGGNVAVQALDLGHLQVASVRSIGVAVPPGDVLDATYGAVDDWTTVHAAPHTTLRLSEGARPTVVIDGPDHHVNVVGTGVQMLVEYHGQPGDGELTASLENGTALIHAPGREEPVVSAPKDTIVSFLTFIGETPDEQGLLANEASFVQAGLPVKIPDGMTPPAAPNEITTQDTTATIAVSDRANVTVDVTEDNAHVRAERSGAGGEYDIGFAPDRIVIVGNDVNSTVIHPQSVEWQGTGGTQSVTYGVDRLLDGNHELNGFTDLNLVLGGDNLPAYDPGFSAGGIVLHGEHARIEMHGLGAVDAHDVGSIDLVAAGATAKWSVDQDPRGVTFIDEEPGYVTVRAGATILEHVAVDALQTLTLTEDMGEGRTREFTVKTAGAQDADDLAAQWQKALDAKQQAADLDTGTRMAAEMYGESARPQDAHVFASMVSHIRQHVQGQGESPQGMAT